MSPVIIAIDPGKSGGIAWRLGTGGTPSAITVPDTEGNIMEFLRGVTASHPTLPAVAYMEEVGGYIHGSAAPGSAMFNFGRNYGFTLGVLQTLRVPVRLVKPQRWQQWLGIGNSRSVITPGMKPDAARRAWKNKLKAEAQRRFPASGVTLATCDALLLLDYATHEVRAQRN